MNNKNVWVKSKHESYIPIRNMFGSLPFSAVARFGSVTEVADVDVECNTIEAINKSSDKRLMKQAFDVGGVLHAQWFPDIPTFEQMGSGAFPIVAKHPMGSRGKGVYLIKDKQSYDNWLSKRTHTNYIFEEFFNYGSEYRLHCTQNECFFAVRKLLKTGVVKNRWKKGGDNTVWVNPLNPLFEMPLCFSEMVEESCKAIRAVGLDIGAVDVKVQKRLKGDGTPREKQMFVVLETNSAPALEGHHSVSLVQQQVLKIFWDKFIAKQSK